MVANEVHAGAWSTLYFLSITPHKLSCFYYFTVAVTQESRSSLAACLWLRVCHEAVVTLLPREAVISRLGWVWRICFKAHSSGLIATHRLLTCHLICPQSLSDLRESAQKGRHGLLITWSQDDISLCLLFPIYYKWDTKPSPLVGRRLPMCMNTKRGRITGSHPRGYLPQTHMNLHPGTG